MGRMACTEPQCLYKGALYLYLSLLKILKKENVTLNSLQVFLSFFFWGGGGLHVPQTYQNTPIKLCVCDEEFRFVPEFNFISHRFIVTPTFTKLKPISMFSQQIINKWWNTGEKKTKACSIYFNNFSLWYIFREMRRGIFKTHWFRTTTLNTNNSTFCPHSVLHVLRGSQNKQPQFPNTILNDFCNRDGVCLLRGMDWIFYYNSD